MSTKLIRERDTGAWVFQAWSAFILSVLIVGWSITHLPGAAWMRGYIFLGAAFTLAATFTLQKTIRDNRYHQVDTPAWRFTAWTAFLTASGATAYGVLGLEAEIWVKGFVGAALLFMMSAAFTLAKTIRDNFEAERFNAADRNRDGQLSPEELRHLHGEVGNFAARDADGDGKLTQREYLA